jgi:mRNA-degrading endonuclease YafQ of YafQ-DinJ toxin-antitoxin module
MSQQHQKQIKRAFEKGKLEQKKEELKIINELIKELSKFEYMEKDGYCLEHKKWEDNTNCITKNDFLANYCETSDVAGAIKILIQLKKEIWGDEIE